MVKRLVQYLKGYVFFIFVILVFALINVVTDAFDSCFNWKCY